MPVVKCDPANLGEKEQIQAKNLKPEVVLMYVTFLNSKHATILNQEQKSFATGLDRPQEDHIWSRLQLID